MITKEEIKEYQHLLKEYLRIGNRLKYLDSKIPKNSKGGGNYIRQTPERDTNVYLKI